MTEKTYEELQQEMYKKLQSQEYMNEVAMPGVHRPVNPDDTNR